ncbi:MAG: dihydroorotase [Gammaproteobacteria bacterium]|nr:dihydroorotase [Gammaproteobacteria bacterium]
MTLTITRPDDWHLHLRDGSVLADLVPHTSRQFARAIVMPNLTPPVINTEMARSYRQRILAAVPAVDSFEPLMSLYLTNNTPADEIIRAKESGIVHGFKYYPAGATTNSDAGVTDIKNAYPALEAMQKNNMILQVHGEVVDPTVDIFDREARFIEQVLEPLKNDLPELKIVFEHITTKHAAQFVSDADQYVAATITPQHLLYNRNEIFKGGIRPHYYCLPVLKREEHRLELVKAACSGNPKFFLGTDSAPHAQNKKESSCGCAGIFSAPLAIELYARSFDENDARDKLESFASFYGADFYGLPRNTDTITLEKKEWTVPASFPLASEKIIPMHASEKEKWKMKMTSPT